MEGRLFAQVNKDLLERRKGTSEFRCRKWMEDWNIVKGGFSRDIKEL
jgi:hypothetical protein